MQQFPLLLSGNIGAARTPLHWSSGMKLDLSAPSIQLLLV